MIVPIFSDNGEQTCLYVLFGNSTRITLLSLAMACMRNVSHFPSLKKSRRYLSIFIDKKYYFSSKICVLGTQKNRLNETVLFEHTQHMLKLMDKK